MEINNQALREAEGRMLPHEKGQVGGDGYKKLDL
jgi:hypothetical protein